MGVRLRRTLFHHAGFLLCPRVNRGVQEPPHFSSLLIAQEQGWVTPISRNLKYWAKKGCRRTDFRQHPLFLASGSKFSGCKQLILIELFRLGPSHTPLFPLTTAHEPEILQVQRLTSSDPSLFFHCRKLILLFVTRSSTMYHEFEVHLHAPGIGFVGIRITAMSAADAGSAARAMYPGATVDWVKQLD